MCLAIPMKLKQINGDKGIVESSGMEKEIHLGLINDVKVGDYLIVHAGFAIQKLDKKEARKTLDLFREMAKK